MAPVAPCRRVFLLLPVYIEGISSSCSGLLFPAGMRTIKEPLKKPLSKICKASLHSNRCIRFYTSFRQLLVAQLSGRGLIPSILKQKKSPPNSRPTIRCLFLAGMLHCQLLRGRQKSCTLSAGERTSVPSDGGIA